MNIVAKTLLETHANGRVLTLFIENEGKFHCLNVPLDKVEDDVVVLKRGKRFLFDDTELGLKKDNEPTEQVDEFVKIIVDMQKRIESIEEKLNCLENNNRSADDIAREISDKLRKMSNYTV